MALSFQDFVLQVKDQSDIVKIISRFVPLKRSGSRFVGVCPFHNDHAPSMYVTPQMGIYKCFVCGAGGDVLKFIQEHEKINFIDSLKMLAGELGLTPPDSFSKSGEREGQAEKILEANALALDFFRTQLKKSDETRKYLELRGISPQTQESFQLGLAPKEWDGLIVHTKGKLSTEALIKAGLAKTGRANQLRDTFVNRLIFPIWNLSHRVVGFGGRTLDEKGTPKYLNSPESPVYQKSRILYGFNFARKAGGPLILVEGYMDVLSLFQQGITNVSAISGTALTDAQGQLISRFADKVYLMLDGDEAGRKAVHRSLPVLLKAGVEVKIPGIPSEEDPDSFAKKFGRAGVEKLLNQSQNIVEFLTRNYSSNKSSISPEDKNRVFQESQSILRHIQADVVREEYLRMLREIMGVSEKSGARVFPIAQPVTKKQGIQMNPNVIRALLRNPEWQLFQLLVSSEELCLQGASLLDLEWIEDTVLRQLVDKLLAYCEEGEGFRLSEFYHRASDNEKMILESVEIVEIADFEVRRKQLEELLRELEKRSILNSMKKLTRGIQNREIDRQSGLRKQIDFQNRLKAINYDKLSLQVKGRGSGNE